MKGFFRTGIVVAAMVAPFAAFAANITTSLTSIGALINLATPIVVALALLGFFWGLAMYIFAGASSDTKKKGLSTMIWGIIALFVMLSVFGIVNALQSTLNVGSGNVSVPQLTNGSSLPATGQTTGTQSGGGNNVFGQ